MSYIKYALVSLAALLMSACATLDGVGARLAASDVSILETALYIQRVRTVDLDLSDFRDRAVVYRAVDSYSELKRGEITEAEFIAEIDAILENRGYVE